MIQAEEILEALRSFENEEQRRILCRFFKTGKGEYGEGDRFLGLKVPQTRAVVRHARLQVPFAEISKLLSSEYHEARLAGFLLLVGGSPKTAQSAAGERGPPPRDSPLLS